MTFLDFETRTGTEIQKWFIIFFKRTWILRRLDWRNFKVTVWFSSGMVILRFWLSTRTQLLLPGFIASRGRFHIAPAMYLHDPDRRMYSYGTKGRKSSGTWDIMSCQAFLFLRTLCTDGFLHTKFSWLIPVRGNPRRIVSRSLWFVNTRLHPRDGSHMKKEILASIKMFAQVTLESTRNSTVFSVNSYFLLHE